MKRTLALLLGTILVAAFGFPSLQAQVSNPTISTSTLTSMKWTVVTWETWSNKQYTFPISAPSSYATIVQSGWKRVMRNDTGVAQTIVRRDFNDSDWMGYDGSYLPLCSAVYGGDNPTTQTVQPGDTIEEDFHYVVWDNYAECYSYTSVTSVSNNSANKAQAVSLSVNGNSSVTVNTGTAVTFNVSGGTTSYSWSVSPAASGFSGPSSSGSQSYGFSFGSKGTYTVSVQAPAGAGYLASNVASVTVNVKDPDLLSQTVSLTADKTSVTAGGSVTFNFSGGKTEYVWSGISGPTSIGDRKTTATFSTEGTYTVSLYAPANATYGQSNTASVTITVGGAGSGTGGSTGEPTAQTSSVQISPASQTIAAGSSITFSASGGSGTGAYTWGGQASGTGANNTVSFASAGSYTVTVYKAADTTYSESNTASASITVTAPARVNQASVSISPSSVTAQPGESCLFTASGGSTGTYSWGGSASGSGGSCWVSFDSPGSYEVTVYSPATSTYNASNTATATVTVEEQEEIEDTNPLVLEVYPMVQRLPSANVRLSTRGGGLWESDLCHHGMDWQRELGRLRDACWQYIYGQGRRKCHLHSLPRSRRRPTRQKRHCDCHPSERLSTQCLLRQYQRALGNKLSAALAQRRCRKWRMAVGGR